MARREERIEHLLRRAGFGGSQDEVAELSEIGYQAAVDLLVFYEQAPDAETSTRVARVADENDVRERERLGVRDRQ